MAVQSEYLVAVVGADVTQFRKSMRDIRNDLGVLAHEGAGFKETFRKLGETLTYAVSTPLAIAGAAAISAASDFDAAMRNINSVAFLSEDAFNGLSEEVFEFGKTTRDGATAAAQALNTIYQAGMEGALALDVMKTATFTAEAGLANVETTAEGLVAAMLAFGFTTADEADRVGDALTRMVQVGVGSMQSFAGSIATFTPSAAALGVAMEEAFGIDAMLTQFGYSASEAAVRTNAAMRSMIKPSEAMSAAITKLGAGSAKELIDMSGGLAEALFALRGTTDGTEEALAELFSDTRALQGVLLLTQNIDRTRGVLADFNAELVGSMDKAREQQMLSFAYAWDTMTSAIRAAGIVIGQQLLPILRPVVEHIREFFLGITELDKRTIGFAISGSAVVAALGPMLWLFSSLLNPVTVVVGAFGALVKAVAEIPGVAEAAALTIKAISDALGPIVGMVDELVTKLFVPEGGGGAGGPMGGFAEAVDDVTGAMGDFRYEVKRGDSLWSIWQENLAETGVTFEDFMKGLGRAAGDTMIQPGEIIDFAGMKDKVKAGIGGLKDGWTKEIVGNFGAGSGFWTTLVEGVGEIGAELEKQIAIAMPKIDKALGGFFMYLGNIFSSTGDGTGDTPVFRWIKGIVDGILGLPESLNNSMPQLTNGLGQFISGMWDWMKAEAIPTAARTIGYIAGKVITIFSRAIEGIFTWLNGGGVGDAAAGFGSFFEDAIATPFQEGLGEALLGPSSGSMVANDEGGGLGGRIQTYIEGELNRVLPLIGTAITNFLNGVAGFFSGTSDTGGQTDIYNGLRSGFGYLFNGDLATDIEAADSPIITAFLNLLTNVGNWIMNDGVPTLARSFGYLAGQIGVAIGRAFGMIGDNGGEAAGSLGNSVLEPMIGGFNDAFKDAGVSDMSLGDKIVTGIAGAIAISAATGILWNKAVSAIGLGLSLAFKGAKWAAGAALNFMDGFIQSVAGLDIGSMIQGVGKAGMEGVGRTVGTAASNLVSAIGFGFKNGGVSGAFSMLSETFIGAWAKGFNRLTGGVLGGIASAIGGAISTAFGAVVATAPWVMTAATALMGLLSNAIPIVGGAVLAAAIGLAVSEALKNSNTGGLNPEYEVQIYDPTVTFAPFSQEGWAEVGAAIGALLNSQPFTIETLPARIAKVDMVLAPGQLDSAMQAWETQYGAYFRDHGVDLDFFDVFNIIPPDGSTFEEVTGMQRFTYGGIEVLVPLKAEPPTEGSGLKESVKDSINTVVTDPEILDMATGLGRTILEQPETYMTNNALDAEKIKGAFVTPIEEVFNGAFGEAGTVTLIWSGFFTSFDTVATDLETRAMTMATEVPNAFQILNDALFPKIDALIVKLGELTLAAITANNALGGGGGLPPVAGGSDPTVTLPPTAGGNNTPPSETTNHVTIVTRAPNGPEIMKELEKNGVYLKK